MYVHLALRLIETAAWKESAMNQEVWRKVEELFHASLECVRRTHGQDFWNALLILARHNLREVKS